MNTIITPVQPILDPADTQSLKIIRSSLEIAESYPDYLIDESRLSGGHADELVFVYSEAQVVECLKRANHSDIPVTVSAGRTGVVGGAVPMGGMIIALEHMNRFLGVRWDEDDDGWIIRIQPGLCLEELKRILDTKNFGDVRPQGDMKADHDFQRFSAESNQWFYPPDPTEKSAHIGGTIATNASGSRSFRYGQTRSYVMGLRVVLADGSVLSLRRGEHVSTSDQGFILRKDGGDLHISIPSYQMPNVKSAAGYFVNDPMDLIDFFIGSEGTLGIFTEVELLLRRKSEFVLGGVAFFKTEKQAIAFIHKARILNEDPDSRLHPSVLEYIDDRSLNQLREKSCREGASCCFPHFPESAHAAIYFEQEGDKADLAAYCTTYAEVLALLGVGEQDAWGGIDETEINKMATFRHAIAEEVNAIIAQRKKTWSRLHKVGMDFVVPNDGLEEMFRHFHSELQAKTLQYVIFGHIGQNHFHVNVLPNNEDELSCAKETALKLAKIAVGLGGTVSGEHGIGKMKKPLLQILYPPEVIGEMRQLKKIFDPKGLLNRGNLF